MKEIPIYLTPGEAARILGVTPAAVRGMVARGSLCTDATTEGRIALFQRKTIEKLAIRRSERGTNAD